MYTGLQVKKDPGVWVVWFGCLLMVLGSIVAFCFSHRRLWATIEADGAHSLVRFGGSAHRNQPAFTLFFDELNQRLDETLVGGTGRSTMESLS
jgi:cytochrome c biogenesis protein